MTLRPRALNTHEMAVEAALARLQKRWTRAGKVPWDAPMEVTAALLPLMVEIATLDTEDQASRLPEVIVAAGGPAAFVGRLAAAVRARLATRAQAIATAIGCAG